MRGRKEEEVTIECSHPILSSITGNCTLFCPQQEVTWPPRLHLPSDPSTLAAPPRCLTGGKERFREKWMLMLWKRQEVNFTRILPTWTDFLPPAANHVLSCQVNSPTASYDHQCRGVWKSIDVDRVCVCVWGNLILRWAFPASRCWTFDPKTHRQLGWWHWIRVWVVSALSGLPLCACVCEAKRNCALWVGVQTRVCVCLTEKEK